MSKKKGPMTAAEAMEQLSHDEEYLRRRKMKKEEQEQIRKTLEDNERPLVESLRDVGINVNSVWDLVNTRSRYPAAISVLVEHLKKPYDLRVKAGIARALAVLEAKSSAWDTLLSEYREAVPENEVPNPYERGWYKDGLAVALGFLCNDESRKEIVLDLVQDKRHGESRVLLLSALFKYFRKDKRVIEVLRRLKTDEDVRRMIEDKFCL